MNQAAKSDPPRLDALLATLKPTPSRFLLPGGLMLVGLGFVAYYLDYAGLEWRHDSAVAIGVILAIFAVAGWLLYNTITWAGRFEAVVSARPGDVVWVYVYVVRRGGQPSSMSLMIGHRSGFILHLGLDLKMPREEQDALQREAALRWPGAALGWTEQRAADFAADPASVVRG